MSCVGGQTISDSIGDILNCDGNNTCADCNLKEVKFASVKHGVFLCKLCAGIPCIGNQIMLQCETDNPMDKYAVLDGNAICGHLPCDKSGCFAKMATQKRVCEKDEDDFKNGKHSRYDVSSGNNIGTLNEKDAFLTENDYFKSYELFDIHETMIADSSRTMAYALALLHSYRSLLHSTVADVGCGTGILSIFAAQAGAAHVVAIEASKMAALATRLVADNQLENKIEVHNCRAEAVQLPGPVDAIVSEWMGYCLLYENMLESVIDFRDRYLKPGGLMFPCKASIYIAAYTDDLSLEEENSEFWDDVGSRYKINFGVLKTAAFQRKSATVHVAPIDQEGIRSNAARLIHIDLIHVQKEYLKSITNPFELTCFGHSTLTALALWFDVSFPDGSILSTSPHEKPTHWQQCLLPLSKPVPVTQTTQISGTVTFAQGSSNKRHLDIHLSATFTDADVVLAKVDSAYSLQD